MKANELRIGNLILNENYQIVEVDVTRIRLLQDGRVVYKPISLTEECLFELEDKYWDFVGYGTRLIYRDRLHPAIKIEKLKTKWAFFLNDELINFKDYLHEAQNLYFALTNEELNYD